MKPAGRHPQKALTTIRVNSLTVPGRYGDGNGLYLIVDPSGAKRWVLRTVVQGTRRDIGLGGLRLVSLAEARAKAQEYRRLAREGGNPVEERRRAKAVPTFADASRSTIEQHRAGWKNEKHASAWINTLTTYVFPIMGEKRVDQIETADVLRTLSPIWLSKPETARRIRRRIKAIFPEEFDKGADKHLRRKILKGSSDHVATLLGMAEDVNDVLENDRQRHLDTPDGEGQ